MHISCNENTTQYSSILLSVFESLQGMAPESNFHSPGTLEFMHTHMGSFQLHSAPETGMGREQVLQKRGRNTRDNLSLLVKHYGIDISNTTGGGSPERLADNEDEPRTLFFISEQCCYNHE